MAVGGVVLGLCVGLIHSLLRLERSNRDQTVSASALARLERDFRSDVHASLSANLLESKDQQNLGLQLNLPEDVAIEFQAVAGGVARLRHSSGDRLQRELYRIGSDSAVSWAVISQAESERIVMEIEPGSRPSGHKIRVEAVRGYHHRYTGNGLEK